MSDSSKTRKGYLWRSRKRRCNWCGKKLTKTTLTCDHVIPLSKGGTHKRTNLVAACYDCNQRKGADIWVAA